MCKCNIVSGSFLLVPWNDDVENWDPLATLVPAAAVFDFIFKLPLLATDPSWKLYN
jgi:hypothetical protein